MYGHVYEPTNKLIDLPQPLINPNFPVLQQRPKDDIYLQYGRGVVRATLEQASREERERNIGDSLGVNMKVNKVSNLADFANRQSIQEAFSRTPISPMSNSSLSPMSMEIGLATAHKERQFDRRKRRKVDTEITRTPSNTPETPSAPNLLVDTGFKRQKLEPVDDAKPDQNIKGKALKRKNLGGQGVLDKKKPRLQGTKRPRAQGEVVKKIKKARMDDTVAGVNEIEVLN